MKFVNNPDKIFQLLNGIVCIYKPLNTNLLQVCSTIKTNLCQELSMLGSRTQIPNVLIQGDVTKQLTVEVKPSFSNNDLVLGPRFLQEDIKCSPALHLEKDTSGVAIIGINNGTKIAGFLSDNHRSRAYRIKGRFGLASDTHYKDGKFVEKSTFRHIKRINLDRLLASIQASHQKKKFELWGVDIQSQEAYELAVSEYVKPELNKIPLIYGIKCVEFNLPHFTLEIHSINEYEKYLHALVHDIGIQMKSTAHCTGVQCIRHSVFSVQNALLKKHWTLQYLLDNLMECNKMYKQFLIESDSHLWKKLKNKKLSIYLFFCLNV